MNELMYLWLADNRHANRLAVARCASARARRRHALSTPALTEPAELLGGVGLRRPRRAPRWWAALDSAAEERCVAAPGGGETAGCGGRAQVGPPLHTAC